MAGLGWAGLGSKTLGSKTLGSERLERNAGLASARARLGGASEEVVDS